MFISSTEEVVFWAMRHGADDMMAFLNVTVAFVCAVFAWILALMAVKGQQTQAQLRHRHLADDSAGQAGLPNAPVGRS